MSAAKFMCYLLLSLFFFLHLLLISSSVSDSTFASTQTRFWSENVENEMPAAISTKLSPLTLLDSDHYSNAISQSNFKADAKFCSLAKLACSPSVQTMAVSSEIYKYDYAAAAAATPKQGKIDPFSFFRSSKLKEGGTIHLPTMKQSLPQRAFLPPQIASKLSLNLKSITKLFPYSSKDAIETSIYYCSAATEVKGEIHSCPKSLEEMIDFSKSTLKASNLLSLTSKNTDGSGKVLVIEKVKQFNVENIVACHEMFLPFATYYCHLVPSSRIYAVDLIEPTTRTPVNTAMAVCHMDTSTWPENHVAFKILKFGPGEGEACHWMNEIDLAWIAAGDHV